MDFNAIQERILELGMRGGVPIKYLRIFKCSPQDGRPHVEINGCEYRYIIEERGVRFVLRKTGDLDELLFWVLDDAISKFAFDSELEHRSSNQDPRRSAFQLRIKLMRQIKEDWGRRTAKYVEDTIRNSPFNDG
jgi:hypothetical protein